MKYRRLRFKANVDDCRPVKWPPKGPYWCSGFNEDYSIVITYLPEEVDVYEYWPEAEDIEEEEVSKIVYTTRFQKPSWWKEEK